MRGLLGGFRDFITCGNVVSLAAEVALSAAFGIPIASLVEDMLRRLIAAIFGEPDFSELTSSISSTCGYGSLIIAMIEFITADATLYLFVLHAMGT